MSDQLVSRNKTHVVAITFPNGKVYRFEARPQGSQCELGGYAGVNMGYVALSGTVGTLVTLDQGFDQAYLTSDQNIGPVTLVEGDGETTWDSNRFRLTLEDGRKFALNT